MKHFIITFIVASFLFASADCAFAFRCGNETISTGDSTELVLARCGRPQNKRFAVEKYQNRWESIEKWYYNCGSKDFIYILTIIHDVVQSEENAGRGTGASHCQNAPEWHAGEVENCGPPRSCLEGSGKNYPSRSACDFSRLMRQHSSGLQGSPFFGQ